MQKFISWFKVIKQLKITRELKVSATSQHMTNMLHCAKMICSNDNLFFGEVNKLRSLFLANNYTNNFFNKILTQFLDSFSCVTTNCDDDDSDKHFVKVPYVGAASK